METVLGESQGDTLLKGERLDGARHRCAQSKNQSWVELWGEVILTTHTAVADVDMTVGDIGPQLVSAEHAIRDTYTKVAKLSEMVAVAHKHLDLSTVAGHEIFASVSDALSAISEANSKMARAHNYLKRLSDNIGYNGPHEYGGGAKPPPQ